MEDLKEPPAIGVFIKTEILEPLRITQGELALRLEVSRLTINELCNGRRAVTASMALRLERMNGTCAKTWLQRQNEIDLYRAKLQLGSRQPV